MKRDMTTNRFSIQERLRRIRSPESCGVKSGLCSAAGCFAAGIALGVFSKWLDNLALDSTVWWHRWIETLNLGVFFSDLAIWLLLALLIAVFSRSPLWAALRVFVFFVGVCAAYHAYTIVFSGFHPTSYMMVWYAITLVSPLLAVLCWYARGTGPVGILLQIGVIAVFFLSCFAIGFFYVDLRGLLYSLVFCGAVAAIYRNLKQLLIALPVGILLAFLLSPYWVYL